MDSFRIPAEYLIALDNRGLHFVLQPYHFMIRAVHVFTVSIFFGAVLLLNLRLLGRSAELPLGPFFKLAMPIIQASLAVTMVTGVTLFLYDPVAVGSHGWLTPKLLFITLGFMNAAWLNSSGKAGRLTTPNGQLTMPGTTAVVIALALWTLTILCSCLNAEPPPRLFLGS
jgi:uncharacterized membrane protein